MKDGDAVCRENSGTDFHFVIESGVGEDFETRTDCAAFRVVCAVDQTRDAGLDHGAGAHAAGLQSDEECCVGHTIVPEEASCFTDHDDFGVGGGIAIANRAVAGAGEDFTVVGDAGADRDFAGGHRCARFFEGELHERDVNVNDFHVWPENSTWKDDGNENPRRSGGS